MTTLHNFPLRVEIGWATRVVKHIMETRNVNDALFVSGLVILG